MVKLLSSILVVGVAGRPSLSTCEEGRGVYPRLVEGISVC
jgi:hypothetical protein